MKIKLLNSCILKGEGTFKVKLLSSEAFKKEFTSQFKANKGKFESYIGYEETARVLEDLLEVNVPISRKETEFESGDIWFFARLKYRVNPKDKDKQLNLSVNSYEFGFIREYVS